MNMAKFEKSFKSFRELLVPGAAAVSFYGIIMPIIIICIIIIMPPGTV